jgi:hypothetical protein
MATKGDVKRAVAALLLNEKQTVADICLSPSLQVEGAPG